MAVWEHKPEFDILVKDVLNPAKAVLIKLRDYLTRPTEETVKFKNSKALVRLRDWFLAHETNTIHGGYEKIYAALWNLGIIKYETDTTYQVRLEETIKQWLKMYEAGEWEFPERPRHKEQHWIYDEENTIE